MRKFELAKSTGWKLAGNLNFHNVVTSKYSSGSAIILNQPSSEAVLLHGKIDLGMMEEFEQNLCGLTMIVHFHDNFRAKNVSDFN